MTLGGHRAAGRPSICDVRAVSLFTGGGGLDLGLERAGFEFSFCIDNDRSAVSALRENQHAGVMLQDADVRCADALTFDFRALARADVALLAGGASCQPFSVGGLGKGPRDARDTFPAVFRALRALQPKMVVLENVRGLQRPTFRSYFERLSGQLRCPFGTGPDSEDASSRTECGCRPLRQEEHYDLSIESLNAADFGVPQKRHRLFLIAVRQDQTARWPGLTATHSESSLWFHQNGSGEYWGKHGLPAPVAPVGWAKRRFEPDELAPWQTVRDGLDGLPAPFAPEHPVPASQAAHVLIPGARSYAGHTGSVWDLPAKTVKAGVHGVAGGENSLQLGNGKVRYFTLRELARLQTFPDSYVIPTVRSTGIRILGNAVPPALAERVGGAAMTVLADQSTHGSGRFHAPRVSNQVRRIA